MKNYLKWSFIIGLLLVVLLCPLRWSKLSWGDCGRRTTNACSVHRGFPFTYYYEGSYGDCSFRATCGHESLIYPFRLIINLAIWAVVSYGYVAVFDKVNNRRETKGLPAGHVQVANGVKKVFTTVSVALLYIKNNPLHIIRRIAWPMIFLLFVLLFPFRPQKMFLTVPEASCRSGHPDNCDYYMGFPFTYIMGHIYESKYSKPDGSFSIISKERRTIFEGINLLSNLLVWCITVIWIEKKRRQRNAE